jgi:hypothetical protein
VREHCPDLVDFGRGHRAIVTELVQACEPGEARHVGGEPEHRGRQVFSFYVEVLQLRQSAQLLQAMLGVGPAEQ